MHYRQMDQRCFTTEISTKVEEYIISGHRLGEKIYRKYGQIEQLENAWNEEHDEIWEDCASDLAEDIYEENFEELRKLFKNYIRK